MSTPQRTHWWSTRSNSTCAGVVAGSVNVSGVFASGKGYGIITLTPDLIVKLDLKDKDLTRYSLATVRQFHEDGKGIEF